MLSCLEHTIGRRMQRHSLIHALVDVLGEIGRKNWLFSKTQAGARASANLYSLIETAKGHGIEPYAYLRQVFKELP